MKPEEFNRKCAEFINLRCDELFGSLHYDLKKHIFDPYYDINDRDRVKEKLIKNGVILTYFRDDGYFFTHADDRNNLRNHVGHSNTVNGSEIICFEKLLESMK